LIISDLHIGNLTDFWALKYVILKAIEMLLRLRVKEVDLVLLGDIHDFQGLYPTQVTLIRGA